jgi:hypothetical protein
MTLLFTKEKQSTEQSKRGFSDRQNALIKREAQALYFNIQQGV